MDYEREILVILDCNGDRVPESQVEFLGIEEDIQGRDILSFVCPVCQEPHKSLRLG